MQSFAHFELVKNFFFSQRLPQCTLANEYYMDEFIVAFVSLITSVIHFCLACDKDVAFEYS